jgi:hypothetical protein
MTKDIEGNAVAPSSDAITASAIGAKGPSTAKALLAFTADPRAKRIAHLGAPIAVAAVTGAVAGALVATAFMRPAAEVVDAAPVATLYDTRMLQGAITAVRSDLMELKASVEADASGINAQLAKFGERFARIDSPKTAREITGSVNRCRPSLKDGSCVTPIAPRRSPGAVASARPK